MEASATTFYMGDWIGALFLRKGHSSAWIRRMLLRAGAHFELHSKGPAISTTAMSSNTCSFNRTQGTDFLAECACKGLQRTAGQDFRSAMVTIWANSLLPRKISLAPQVGWNTC